MLAPAITSTVSIATARAIFSINEFQVPEDEEGWHGLKENECWNSQINPEDPGWALLTADEFYAEEGGQHPELAQYTARYRELPAIELLKPDGVAIKPEHDFLSIDYEHYAETFENYPLPDEYLGVLPGIPSKLPKFPRRGLGGSQNPANYAPASPGGTTGNNTLSTEEILRGMLASLGIETLDLDNLDQYDDDVVDTVLKTLKELKDPRIKRWEELFGPELPSPTEPMQTGAQQTALGQGDATPTPAIQGRLATAGLPTATMV